MTFNFCVCFLQKNCSIQHAFKQLTDISTSFLCRERLVIDSKDAIWLKITGICGILTPMVACTCILFAINYSPDFNCTENALSDLGIQEGVTSILFNSGLIIGGILSLIFATGLFMFLREKTFGKIGALIFILASLALTAIGIFPENVKPTHYYVSVAFFTFSPIAMIVIGTTFLLMAKVKMCLFTFLAATVAAVVWIVQFSIKFVSGVAIPEAISALSVLTWSIVLSFMMLRQVSQSNK